MIVHDSGGRNIGQRWPGKFQALYEALAEWFLKAYCNIINSVCSISSRAHSDCGECSWSDEEGGSGEKEEGVV